MRPVFRFAVHLQMCVEYQCMSISERLLCGVFV